MSEHPIKRIRAKWIWAAHAQQRPYNHTIFARKRLTLGTMRRARLLVTADSQYRVYINGRWVNDGPCRGWPEHYYYDELDLRPYLIEGDNEILVLAKFYGVGTMQGVPQEPGLLVQLELEAAAGKKKTVISDDSWEVAEARAWLRDTPKISLQMGPFEYYDAGLEGLEWAQAVVHHAVGKGPWRNLQPRNCPLLTRTPFPFRSFREANVVRRERYAIAVPMTRLLHPGLIEANMQTSAASAVATIIHSNAPRTVSIHSNICELRVDGEAGEGGAYRLRKGKNLLLAIVREIFPFSDKELTISFGDVEGLRFENPLEPALENAWVFIPFEEGAYADAETHFIWMPHPKRAAVEASFAARRQRILDSVWDIASFNRELGHQALCLPSESMLLRDPYESFRNRSVVEAGWNGVKAPAALVHDNASVTTVYPANNGDVEVVYDLGEQNCGYFDIELIAEAGLIVDVFAVEHITPEGRVQHTFANRNGMRYVCKEGVNCFTSIYRRAGRYVFITLRNQSRPVEIRLLQLIESTYPVVRRGSFECSDPLLNDVWNASLRTLKLCMEDTFTDCPLYERVHWVGDMRNEAVFAYGVFGAEDLARRCVELGAQSLERYPIVGAQVPSSLDLIIPAWSFLWGITVWEYFFYTGDKAFLRTVFPAVMRNLENACAMRNPDGLFSAPYWNMLDWTNNDDRHETVLHNSISCVGAINAAVQCAEVLDKGQEIQWLRARRREFSTAVNRLWNAKKGAYPDSIHEDGTISPVVSQHTSFLAYLHDVIPAAFRDKAVENMVRPPREMRRVGSPFAVMFLYEALLKAGREDVILASVRQRYAAMLEAGATTVWEKFSEEGRPANEHATRSHCHAWSAAPLYFLGRIVLGIRQTAPGGTAFTISPYIADLDRARGTWWTVKGPIAVDWVRAGRKITIEATAPRGVQVKFVKNPSLEGMDVSFNGRQVKRPATSRRESR